MTIHDVADIHWQMFKQRLQQRWRLDLNAYREERIRSRVQSWMRRRGIESLHDLTRQLEREPGLYEQLQDALFINTSSFFRDEGVFTPLQQRILPELVHRFQRLSIWSAACSFGAEPYTLSILLHELGQGGGGFHQILGTDIDSEALRQAEDGAYHPQHLDNLPAPLRQRYFTLSRNEAVIHPNVKRGVRFQQHNLLSDPLPGQFHLILCRNVLIYFTPETQKHIVGRLASALPTGGYLVIGSTEGIFNPQALGLVREIHAIYRKDGADGKAEAGNRKFGSQGADSSHEIGGRHEIAGRQKPGGIQGTRSRPAAGTRPGAADQLAARGRVPRIS